MSKKTNASERYKVEYTYGLKHQAVLQFLNTICRKMVLLSDLNKILIDFGYCKDRSSASRLIQNLESKQLIMRYPKSGKNIVQIRKLGILVAENKEDMDSVKNINHKRINDQDLKLELISYRIKLFYKLYRIDTQRTLQEAMDSLLVYGETSFGGDVIEIYKTINNAQNGSNKDELLRQVKNIKEMKEKRSAQASKNKKEVPKVEELNTLDTFARKDIFVTGIYATSKDELVADVVLFNYATDITVTRIKSLNEFHSLLSRIGIKYIKTTIISRSEVASKTSFRTFRKKQDGMELISFSYFDGYELKDVNQAIDVITYLNQLDDQIEKERKIEEDRKRKLEEREELLKKSRYYQFNFKEVLSDVMWIHWIERNMTVKNFDLIIDYILESANDFNNMDLYLGKILVEEYNSQIGDYESKSKNILMDYARKSFRNLKHAHNLYIKLMNLTLLDPTVKEFKRYIIQLNEHGELVVRQSTGLHDTYTKKDYDFDITR